jgi:hypothetical protein
MDAENQPGSADLILYTSPSGHTRIEVWHQDESFWLTQKRMSELFGVDVRTVSEHLQNIFATRELDEDSVIRKFRITAEDGNATSLTYTTSTPSSR